MQLADAPATDTLDGATITLSPALLRGDRRLEAIFEPFRECVVLHETLMRDRGAAGATRLLMAEIDRDRYDDVCAIVRRACGSSTFTEKPTERDDVAAGTEWAERAGSSTVAVYRLFGGSTSLHAKSSSGNTPNAAFEALQASPLALLADVVDVTSFVETLSCSRSAKHVPQWHLQASLRDRRFEELAPRLVALGFEMRGESYWRENIIVRAVGKQRWMAALPGITLPGR